MKQVFTDYIESGYISVWIGNFTSEDYLDDYLGDQFANDFGFEVPPGFVCEIGFEPSPVSIRTLLDGFSFSETFAAAVQSLAEAGHKTTATSMFIMYNFKYDVSHQKNKDAQLCFIGAARFRGFE